MSNEDKLISLINSVMPSSPLRLSKSGEVDAEVFILDNNEYLFTTDDFSGEDLLKEDDPYLLGWNIACGAVSDIIAAGGKPLAYAHSVVIPNSWTEPYIREFSRGVSAILQRYSVSFIGGDIGIADRWRYTASVIGKPVGRKVNRRGCQAGDPIYITGKIGAGNLEAVLSLYSGNESIAKLTQGRKNKFHTLEKLPEVISKYASSAIDTSDGVFAALQTVSGLNDVGYRIDQLPFLPKCVLAAGILQVPTLLFFLGECGEYEILFTVGSHHKESLETELKKLNIQAWEIGVVKADPKHRTVMYNSKEIGFQDYALRARDFSDVNEYLGRMKTWIMQKGIR